MDASNMPNPFRQEVPRRAPPPGVGSKDLMRLYVMAVVLVIVVGTMFFMYKESRLKPPPKKDRGGVSYRQDPDPKAQPSGTQEPVPPKEKKVIDIAPLPKDGKISFGDLAAPFPDGTEKPVKETPEFITLLSVMMNSVTPERITEEVTPGLTADAAYGASPENRGKVLRVYGRLITIYTERIEATTPDNIEVVYMGVMQEYRTWRTVLFYIPALPVDPETGERVKFNQYVKGGQRFYRDWVEVEGVYLRQYDYESQGRTERGEATKARSAMMFAKTLRIAKSPTNLGDPRGPFLFVVLGLGVVVAGIIVVVGIISRKHSAGSMRLRMHQVKREKGKEVFPKPNPEKQVLGDEIPKPDASAPGADAPKFVDPGDKASPENPS